MSALAKRLSHQFSGALPWMKPSWPLTATCSGVWSVKAKSRSRAPIFQIEVRDCRQAWVAEPNPREGEVQEPALRKSRGLRPPARHLPTFGPGQTTAHLPASTMRAGEQQDSIVRLLVPVSDQSLDIAQLGRGPRPNFRCILIDIPFRRQIARADQTFTESAPARSWIVPDVLVIVGGKRANLPICR